LRTRPALEWLETRLNPSTVQFSSAYYLANENAGQAVITVARTGDTSSALTVDYATSDGSAHANVRYQAASSTLTIPAGQSTASFSVQIINDSVVDFNQTVHLALSNPGAGATLGLAAATLTIVDDESVITTAGLGGSNAIIQAGLGVKSLQYAPDGALTQLLWIEDQSISTSELTYLWRNPFGNWIPERIPDASGAHLSQYGLNVDATLLFGADGVPNVFLARPSGTVSGAVDVVHYKRGAQGWQQVETFTVGQTPIQVTYVAIVSALGPNGQMHLAITMTDGSTVGEIWHAASSGGPWTSEKVTSVGRQVLIYGTPFGIRALSLAVDSQNHADLTFVPEFKDATPGSQQFHAEFSVLGFATNASGSWQTQVVYQPPDYGDAGMSASVAVSPNGTVAIASFYVHRVPTGSASGGVLLYHVRQADGSWVSQVIASSSAGYQAADGNLGTGFGAQLVFDAAGNPNIAFSDFATQHTPGVGATEYVGQLRRAIYVNGAWNFSTIFSQSDPLHQQLFFPSIAVSPAGVAFAGLEADADSNTFFVVTANDVVSRFAGRALQIATNFAFSSEYLSGIVGAAYSNYLKRSTDAGGLNYWIGRLQSNLTDEQLEAALLSSAEYINSNGGLDGSGHAGSAWVVAMYRDLLGRNADPGGLSYWTGQLNQGISPFSIAIGFAASLERETTRINSDYLLYLDRPVDSGGLIFWLGQFQAGVRNENLIAGFIGSQEYYYNHGQGVTATWISSLYHDILHRAPNDSELQSWLTFLNS
jgi:hypothetical protein